MHSTIKVQSFFGLGQEQNHNDEWSFEADHPEVFGATDGGITPIEYLLVGLASLPDEPPAWRRSRRIAASSLRFLVEVDGIEERA